MAVALVGSSYAFKPLKPFFSRNPWPPPSPTTVPLSLAEARPFKKQSSMDGGGRSAPRGKSSTRKRSSYGTSRRSVIKKSFSQEQVVFTSPVAPDPVVGIIGGGIAGLVCAATLEERGIRSTVFDTKTMVNIMRPCWISQLDPFNGKWHLSEKGKLHGQFDTIVIAHNGKCANRLLSSSGLPLLTKQMKRLELSAIWALLTAFKDPLPTSCNGTSSAFEGAFVKGVNSISWMANNTSKLFPSCNSLPQCWSFFSTAAYGKQNKVPQESIPNITAEKVKEDMLGGVETALGLTKGSLPRPFYTRVQLWGAALPTNTPGIPFIFDPQGRGGICGDWLLGSSVESAALSGMALANHIADYFQSGGSPSDDFAVGLHDVFQPVGGHDIGQFPGIDHAEQNPKSLISVAG